MSDIWHSAYTIPVRCNEHVPVEVELITGKYGVYYTSGYGIVETKDVEYALGWLYWVKRWRFLFDEEEVKEVE